MFDVTFVVICHCICVIEEFDFASTSLCGVDPDVPLVDFYELLSNESHHSNMSLLQLINIMPMYLSGC